MTKILVAGASGLVNSGDEAILEVMLGDLKKRDVEIQVLSFNATYTSKAHHVTSYNHSYNIIEYYKKIKWLL